ncbi:hypothetical protein BJ912DRAFT_946119 [Pholiota molesta]|nr:hypothetical protein BJ912DRAFT_946119 [Pholiota molesta]
MRVAFLFTCTEAAAPATVLPSSCSAPSPLRLLSTHSMNTRAIQAITYNQPSAVPIYEQSMYFILFMDGTKGTRS